MLWMSPDFDEQAKVLFHTQDKKLGLFQLLKANYVPIVLRENGALYLHVNTETCVWAHAAFPIFFIKTYFHLLT